MNKPYRFVAVLLALLLCSCYSGVSSTFVRGSGTLASEDRPVQGVRGVTLATSGELTITLGSQEALRVEAEDNLLPYLETQVRGGTLTIATRPGVNVQTTRPMRYTLTVKSLEALAITSSGNITAPALQADRFTATISSNGNIHLDGLSAAELRVQIGSNGSLEIGQGEVKQQTIGLSSSGQYKAGNLRSQNADVNLSSNGGATIWVTGNLKANLSSSGNVSYYGKPAITGSKTSNGKTIALGDK